MSALIIAASYIFGFGLFIGFLDRSGYSGPSGDLAFVVDNQLWLSVAMIVLYVIAGCALVVLGLAFHERLKGTNSNLAGVGTAFAMIWAGLVIASGFVGLIGIKTVVAISTTDLTAASTAWIAISVVQDALGGGIELVGGVWMLIISWVALTSTTSNKAVHCLGLLIGSLGVVTIVPGLGEAAALFGLFQIIWFVWIAFDMFKLRQSDIKT
ncbi:hypothetical protein [Erythrobacter sp. Alg231-14]|uniref:hypothetical protein n=1 Tax=Erythrobacter sp. Alg231-14 TaxID=1922225 RepID=UPI00307C9615